MKPIRIPSSASARLPLLLVVLVLLPVVFYTVWEFSALSETEQVLLASYERQLDAILFSINQHAWDVSTHWTTELRSGLWEETVPPRDAFRGFLARTPAVARVDLLDSSFQEILSVSRAGEGENTGRPSLLPRLLRSDSLRFRQLTRYATAAEYRKIEPLLIPREEGGAESLALVVVVNDRKSRPLFLALTVQQETFISTVIGPKLSDLGGEDFVLGAFRSGHPRPIVSSGELEGDTLAQRRALWLLPEHAVGIGPRGTTVDELIRGRLVRNMAILILVNLVLLAGAFLVFRNVRAQVALARAKSTFVSNVSHELRTPLALIRMFAETLEMGRLKDERKKQEYYGTILRETERLTHLVNNILNFSRMEAGRKEYNLRPVDANHLVRTVLDTYAPHFHHQGITPATSLAGEPLLIHADADAVTEAVINLVDNAVKYGGADKSLTVRTCRQGNAVCIEVEDRGIGIAPEHQRKIFEAFYRVPTGLVHETKGSGIGLSLVHHIMTAHGGSVGVSSEPGSGSCFRLLFPAAPSGPAVDADRQSAAG